MNRQIKFRQYIWDNDKKINGRMENWDELLAEEGESLSATFSTSFSNASPLMQYTGLTDRNGIELWEGDILGRKSIYTDEMYYRIVKWDEKLARFIAEGEVMNDNLPSTLEQGYEKLGNIYENADLLPKAIVSTERHSEAEAE